MLRLNQLAGFAGNRSILPTYTYYRLNITASGQAGDYGDFLAVDEFELLDGATIITPTMTSNTTPSGIVTASSEYGASYYGYKAFDRASGGQPWCCAAGVTTATLTFQLASPASITKYAIRIGTPLASWRTPTTWQVQGSYDGASWTTLHSGSYSSWTGGERREYVIVDTGYVALGSSAIWNAGDKGAAITLSGGDLTAAWSTYTGSQVRANTGKNSGKWYWEIVQSARSGSSYWNVGVGPAPAADMYGTAGAHRFAPGDTSDGQVIGFRFDASGATGILYVYKNNSLVTTKTGLSLAGLWYPEFSEDNSGGTGTVVANFGATAFTYPPP